MNNGLFKLNVSDMQENSLQRSKQWSKFLKNFEEFDDDKEIDLNDLDAYYTDRNDNIDESVKCEMAEEEDPVESEDIYNSSNQNAMMLVRNIVECSNAPGILAQINQTINETGIIDSEIQKFFEETLPIVEEYRRNTRDSGFESLLSTFNLKEIEDNAPMLQNNSITSLSFSSPNERVGRDFYKKRKFFYNAKRNNYESDSDSLHSMDTARYIRSSKIHKCIATTTIKSYRLVESKRNKLRKKYAHLIPDDTLQMMRKERHQLQPNSKYPILMKYSNDIHKIDKNFRRSRQRGRLVRHSHNFSNASYTSSEEESFEGDKKMKRLCCARQSLCSNRSERRNQHPIDNDVCRLPYMRESECACRGSEKLCENARHLADSSFEDWFVENCESPLKNNQKDILPTPRNKINVSNELSKGEKDHKEENDCKIKKVKQGKENSNGKSQEVDSDSSFERELQMAIKLSKQEHLKQENLKKKKLTKKTGRLDCKSKEIGRNDEKSVKASQIATHTLTPKLLKLKTVKPIDNNESLNFNLKLELKPKRTSNTKKIAAKANELDHSSSDSSLSQIQNGIISYGGAENVKASQKSTNLTPILSKLKIGDLTNNHQLVNCNYKLESKPRRTSNTKKRTAKTSESENCFSNSSLNEIQNGRISEGEANVNEQANKLSSNKTPKIVKIAGTGGPQRMKKSALKAIAEENCAFQLSGPDIINLNKNNQSSRLKEQVDCTYNSTDYTALFTNSANVCNSTALANKTATSRQLVIETSNKNLPHLPVTISKNLETDDNKLKTKDLKYCASPTIPLYDAVQDNQVVSTEMGDCDVISSTTGSDMQISKHKKSCNSDNNIVLYSPMDPTLAPSHCVLNGRFKLTEEHLSSNVGQKTASNFMKYYVGPKYFRDSSTVYFIPPMPDAFNDSSDSEVDFLNLCSRYGEVVEVKQKSQTFST